MYIPQTKPMHGFSPNFQDMFTPRGFGAVFKVLGVIWQQLLPWQHFKYFWVLMFLIEKRGAISPMLLQLHFYILLAKHRG